MIITTIGYLVEFQCLVVCTFGRTRTHTCNRVRWVHGADTSGTVAIWARRLTCGLPAFSRERQLELVPILWPAYPILRGEAPEERRLGELQATLCSGGLREAMRSWMCSAQPIAPPTGSFNPSFYQRPAQTG